MTIAVFPVNAQRVWFRDWHGAQRPGGLHEAQDIFAPEGTTVVAPEAGRITQSGYYGPRSGIAVHLETSTGRRYLFAHLADVVAHDSQIVPAGAPLGHVGRTGSAASTRPHLHIQAREGGVPVNLFLELQTIRPFLVKP